MSRTHKGPKFGCDGSGYAFAKVFGHEIIKPLPALTALKSSAPFLKKVSGVRNQAEITLEIDGEPVKKRNWRTSMDRLWYFWCGYFPVKPFCNHRFRGEKEGSFIL